MHHPLVGQGTWMGDVVPAGTQPRPEVTTHILMTGPEFFATVADPGAAGPRDR